MPSTSVIVLAAGESTRMGRQKALLPWHGVTLLEYQLAQIGAVDAIDDVIVVTGHAPERVSEIAGHAGATVAHNADYRSGKVSSIIAGIRAVRQDTENVMLLAVDQPRTSQTLAAIISAHDAAGSLITVPAHAGRRGHPVLFASTLLPELADIQEETHGIREVLRRHAGAVQEVEISGDDVLIDLNEPSDMADQAAR